MMNLKSFLQKVSVATKDDTAGYHLSILLFYWIDMPYANIVFEFIEWESKDEDSADVNVWEDNWDDDTVEDDFSVQLR